MKNASESEPMTQSTMIDPFGRTIDYLRVSVTDRCDFRCVYCMAEDMTFLPSVTCSALRNWTASAPSSLKKACGACA
ncbi:molybdenum cofactor biosynthesis protein A [Nitratireductor aquibiodomus RA22]|uniref:Molybdenum cofactor biosynthesis protein A n=1 Tax=Nitratireductor aquibiodomus RA22 TaxID=1189611 RepID=I5C0A5_9HYPH|nr:molybdenum cofactor biosynthesis protein A [Nitratireductor aquibiodomus RA22]